MGDSGSLFIGMMVGGLNVLGPSPYNRGTVAVLMLPVLLLLVPIFDTLFVSVACTIAGPIDRPGRTGDHTSHRLVSLGMSERGAVIALWGMALASGWSPTGRHHYGLSHTVTLVGPLAAGLLVLGAKLGLQRVYPHKNDTAVVRVLADVSYKKVIATISIDAALVVLAYYSAYLPRFEGALGSQLPAFSRSLLIVLLTHVAALGLFGTYQESWRHAGVRDLVKLSAVTLATAAQLSILAVYRFDGFSRAVFGIHWLVATILPCGSRVAFRALGELLQAGPREGPKTLIMALAPHGVMVLREARSNSELEWNVIGFYRRRSDQAADERPGRLLGGLDQVAALLVSGVPRRWWCRPPRCPTIGCAR
ncbi:MAG: hypothetical protein R2708_22045 [Vicinamibacterales bacterium]